MGFVNFGMGLGIPKIDPSQWPTFYMKPADEVPNNPESVCNNTCQIINKGGVYKKDIPEADIKINPYVDDINIWRYTIYKYPDFEIHEYSYTPTDPEKMMEKTLKLLILSIINIKSANHHIQTF